MKYSPFAVMANKKFDEFLSYLNNKEPTINALFKKLGQKRKRNVGLWTIYSY